MNRFRDYLTRVMYGRYGSDELSRFISILGLVLLLFTFFFRNPVLYFAALILVIYAYYRILSRNISKRNAENQIFLKYKYNIIRKVNNFKFRMKDQRTHKIFKCPSCSQKIRIPRGKGNICIKCPKCRIEFNGKS